MSLRGQARSETGYAMAALLVSMAVMAILMGAALPVWRHEAQREKEEELVFRGQQYIRALRLYQSRTQTLPNSVDLLVNGHFLRKKYKDPVTGGDFELIGAGGVPGQAPGGAQGGRASQPPQSQPQQGSSLGGGTVSGGIMGVRSKSKEESIRLYQGRNHYNEWTFLYVRQNPGGPQGGPQRGGPQRGGPPQRGGQPQRGGPQGGPGTFQPPGGFPAGGFPGGGFPGQGGAGPNRGGGTQVPGGGTPVPGGGRRGGGGGL